MPDYPTLDRIAELQQFIASLARVERVCQLADLGRAENDVEHSYGLALTCWFLAPKIAPDLSLEKIFSYALAHDSVEVHAGDTFIFADQAALDSKSNREDAAIATISKDWADFPELADFADGYKNKRDEEAKFVYAVDKILPILMVQLGQKDVFWNAHQVTLQMEIDNKTTILKSALVAPYYKQLVEWMTAHDNFYKPNA